MSDPKTPAITDQPAVSDIFAHAISDLSEVMSQTHLKDAVDIELNFKSVTTDSNGVPLFTKHSTESTLEIRLATRLTPASMP
jgi:hypothetical protein